MINKEKLIYQLHDTFIKEGDNIGVKLCLKIIRHLENLRMDEFYCQFTPEELEEDRKRAIQHLKEIKDKKRMARQKKV